MNELRFLAFDRKTSTVTHYVRFQITKKTGGVRQISAPMPRLKALQHWLLQHILEKVENHDCAHGFREGRSIVTNLLCRRLDRRLLKAADELGFIYTRYADDLTFSASGENLHHLGSVLARVQAIVTHEGFTIHPAKTRVIRRSRQQDVTGVIVNSKPNVSRPELKRFRAALYQIEKDGLAGKRWGHSRDVTASIQGFANFVHMVNPEKGLELQQRVRSIAAKYNWAPVKVERQPAPQKPESRQAVINPPRTESDQSVNPAPKKW
jgi:hypothetical protein